MARRADIYVALVLLVFCGIFLSDLMNTTGSGAFVKTTTLPTMLVIVLASLSVLLLLGNILMPPQASKTVKTTDRPQLFLVAALVAWVVAYVIALPWLGYMLASGLFLIGASLLFGNRRWGVILSWAVLMPMLLMLFFEKVMLILLPSSWLLR